MIGAKAAGMRCIALVPDGNADFIKDVPVDLIVRDLREAPIEMFLD